MKIKLAVILCLAAAPFGLAQKKTEVAEINREIGLLRDDLLKMQEKMDESLANIKAAIQATLEQVNATNRNVALLDKAMHDKFSEQQQALNRPVGALASKVDSMGDDFRNLKESVVDLNAKLTKIQQQIVDLDTAVRTISKPPEPPPSAVDTGAPPPAGVSAEKLWDSAMRDKTSGNYELALGEFNDYLKYFPKTDGAPEAQFYAGQILYAQGKYEEAVTAFDAVLEKYSENKWTLEARLMKGKTLAWKLNRRDDAKKEFQALVDQARGKEIADRASAELRQMARPPANSKRTPKK